jgi:hypothetical protein
MNNSTKDRLKKYPTLQCALSMSKAEGNLKFLAESKSASITQGTAVLDALHAIQQARKEYNKVLQELNLLRDGLVEES